MSKIVGYDYITVTVEEIHPDMKTDSDVELTEQELEEYLQSIYGETGETGDSE